MLMEDLHFGQDYFYNRDPLVNDPQINNFLKFCKIYYGEIKLKMAKVIDVGALCNYLF
jgi:hypothetical protein